MRSFLRMILHVDKCKSSIANHCESVALGQGIQGPSSKERSKNRMLSKSLETDLQRIYS